MSREKTGGTEARTTHKMSIVHHDVHSIVYAIMKNDDINYATTFH